MNNFTLKMKGLVLAFVLSFTFFSVYAQPANDLCAGATPITPSAEGTGCGVATFTLPFTTDGTTDSGVPTVCSTPGNDQWFTWTATTAGLTFSSESPGNPGIAVFANCADAAAGTDIACLGTFSNGTLSGWNVGDNLIIQIYDFSGSSADVAFCLEEYAPPAPPANDLCANAEAVGVNADLSCTIVASGTINSATASGEDESTCSGTEDDDVWYSFVATATSHEISLINLANGTTDLYHSVWSGTCGSLTNILCSDPNSSTASGLTIGETYLLRVYSWTSTAGQTTDFDVCIGTLPPPPANDACAGAIAVTQGASTASGSTAASTNVEGLSPCSGNSSPCATSQGGTGGIDFTSGLWFVYTSSGSEEITFDTDGSNFDTEIQIFTGSCGALACVGGDDDSGASTQSLICVTSAASLAPVDYYIYIDGHGTATGDFVLNIAASPLPVELISFEGKTEKSSNMLMWSTASEENTEKHVIERSIDGRNNWIEIGSEKAAGFTNETQSYMLEDKKPVSRAYYRLRSVDFDGYEDVSELVYLERKSNAFDIISVYPNPTKAGLTVDFEVVEDVTVQLQLTDMLGKTVAYRELDANAGVNSQQIDMNNLASGIYFINIFNGETQLTQRILKN